jgi:hypothetical protein
MRTFASEPLGRGESDSGGSTGNDGDLAFKFA